MFGHRFFGARYFGPRYWGDGGIGGAVFPAPGQVLSGVVYGPNGNDYTGTLVAGGGAVFLRRR